MPGKSKSQQPSASDLATKGDVESIVTRVVNHAIDNFAVIVGRSFADTQSQINGIVVELREFKGEMYEFRGNTERALYTLQTDMTELKGEMRNVKTRLDKVESIGETMIGMWRNHESRIVVLEDQASGF